jgi:hypothetical protein
MLRASMRKKLPYFDYVSDAVVLNIYIRAEAEEVFFEFPPTNFPDDAVGAHL